MQILIDTMQCPCRTLNNECGISLNECYEDDICSSCPLIRNGGVKLPKGHGRLIDADYTIKQLLNLPKNELSTEDMWAIKVLDLAPTIIEADKEDKEL